MLTCKYVNTKDSQRYWTGHLRRRKLWGGKVLGVDTANSRDLLCLNCKIIRQASKRTWHLAPKGGVCVKERFVGKTYCRCQHALNYTSDSLERGAHNAQRHAELGTGAQTSSRWKEIMGNYTFSACIINHHNHLLYTALLSIPPG